MHPKIKFRPAASGAIGTVKPLVLHDVTNRSPRSGARLRQSAGPARNLPASHARHHVARKAQA